MCTSELWGIIIPILCLLAGCSTPSNERDQILVNINGRTITVEDFERSYVQDLILSGQNDTPKARYAHLEALIEQELWYEEALRRRLNPDSLSPGYTDMARKRALGQRFYELQFLEQLPELTETEVRLAFVRYKQPVIARHLFYRNASEAYAAHARLKSGNSFLDEAQLAFQTETFDSTAGWLGELRYFQVDDAIAEAAFALSTDTFSLPVRSRHGWHIIKIKDRILAPMITESEFQNRRSGISGLLRLRKRRLEGDAFVRSFMETQNVKVNPEGVRSLAAALGRMTQTSFSLNDGHDTAPLPLLPTSLLATFGTSGVTYTFTGEDYFSWLPFLPISEATSNPAASLGRAIRNEALAMAGMNLGLEKDWAVQMDMLHFEKIYLAKFMGELESDSTLLDVLRSATSIYVDTMIFHQIMIN